jgi:hypothetical protein
VVSKRLKARLQIGGTLLLDAQGLSLHADGDAEMRYRVEFAERNGFRVACSALTPLEVRRTGRAADRLRFVLSRFEITQVTEDVVATACKLLDISGLDGHECLVDAVVVATAALAKPPVLLVTSDRSHIPELCKAAAQLPQAPTIRPIVV